MRGFLTAILICCWVAPLRAADIAIALTDDVVDVDAGFSGARVVLFGALTGVDGSSATLETTDDIVAVVRGPEAKFRLRPMLHERLIWTAGPAIIIHGAPGILLTSSTRQLSEFTTPELRQSLGLNADALGASLIVAPTNDRAADIIEARGVDALEAAFLDAAGAAGLFGETESAVSFKKGPLFSINIELPPTTPVGEYVVDIYLIRDGALLSQDSALLAVRKVGIERSIYDLAHTRPIAYGIGCVAISLAAGWLAAAAFRKSA